MEVKDILKSAIKAVAEAEVPDDLREVAFAKAIDLLAGPDSGSITAAGTRASAGPAPTTAEIAGSPMDQIAARLGMSSEAVREVFSEDDGLIDIAVSPRKLDSAKKEASKQIALLLASGRQAAGVEDWTGFDVIRGKCEEFRKLDSSNFAKAVTEMDDEFSFQGSGKNRSVKVSRQGWLKAADLVKQLTGEDGS